ncbi:hypothetical protein [Lipingzhangella rawalii]|uniref:hypothetical protein n=1 Tax=Lipingzhangella rawalii TaxID=2055835 RepID=UPI00287B709F|nr:hypothetical protein [Lipingzhangella rawalii]
MAIVTSVVWLVSAADGGPHYAALPGCDDLDFGGAVTEPPVLDDSGEWDTRWQPGPPEYWQHHEAGIREFPALETLECTYRESIGDRGAVGFGVELTRIDPDELVEDGERLEDFRADWYDFFTERAREDTEYGVATTLTEIGLGDGGIQIRADWSEGEESDGSPAANSGDGYSHVLFHERNVWFDLWYQGPEGMTPAEMEEWTDQVAADLLDTVAEHTLTVTDDIATCDRLGDGAITDLVSGHQVGDEVELSLAEYLPASESREAGPPEPPVATDDESRIPHGVSCHYGPSADRDTGGGEFVYQVLRFGDAAEANTTLWEFEADELHGENIVTWDGPGTQSAYLPEFTTAYFRVDDTIVLVYYDADSARQAGYGGEDGLREIAELLHG